MSQCHNVTGLIIIATIIIIIAILNALSSHDEPYLCKKVFPFAQIIVGKINHNNNNYTFIMVVWPPSLQVVDVPLRDLWLGNAGVQQHRQLSG